MKKILKKWLYPNLRYERGMTFMPALAMVGLLGIVTIQVNIPQQMALRQQHQTMANNNASVQLISAILSYYNDTKDPSGANQWPDPTRLNTELAPYLPIFPQNLLQMANLAIGANNKATLTINTENHTNAKQLAWQFSAADMEIVNAVGDPSENGSRVAITLDPDKYGQWGGYNTWHPADKCPYETGKQTSVAEYCSKNGTSPAWCLGNKVTTRNCRREPEWIEGQYVYGACADGKQPKTPGCKKGWNDGERVDCDAKGVTQLISCKPAYWQAKWDSWGETKKVRKSFYENQFFDQQERGLLSETCIKGFVNETEQDCNKSLKLPTDIKQVRSRNEFFNRKDWRISPVLLKNIYHGDELVGVLKIYIETREKSCGSLAGCTPKFFEMLNKGEI